ncbi:2Fe-2S iron-sulfur cluster-binding protein [Xylophilus sp.]|uniref:2Fe-2S iron-sulfur cluster-binding protein n=1 Tax=Xylophilus sp. TaxID=2653893 RepID=UPI0013BC1DF4|nr:2Fe-2S iron-sulfur cluster-binding protein [Xylophilus sp.]KAF1045553.1 MAG: Fumarate reductase iron-sulfur subunit [Xylophilus sp.]
MTTQDTTIQLRVHRGSAHQPGTVEVYPVPADAAASLLDGLRWVRAHRDGTLAFRYACINANACKECMVRLDGKTVYACTARLEPGRTYEVAPLPNKPLVRDLVTEIAPAKERLFAGDETDGD